MRSTVAALSIVFLASSCHVNDESTYTYCDPSGCYTCDSNGCTPTANGWGSTAPSCSTNEDCTTGSLCDPNWNQCAPASTCSVQSDCGNGYYCDDRDTCVVGASCSSDDDCASVGDGFTCQAGTCAPGTPTCGDDGGCTVDGSTVSADASIF